eukprot:COSAG04_NODE_212_length_20108_cov_107.515418_5_plen_64_part_00
MYTRQELTKRRGGLQKGKTNGAGETRPPTRSGTERGDARGPKRVGGECAARAPAERRRAKRKI